MSSTVIWEFSKRLGGGRELVVGGRQLLADLLQARGVVLGEAAGLGAPLGEGGLDRVDELLLPALQRLLPLLQADDRWPGW